MVRKDQNRINYEELISVINQIEKERKIDRKILISATESAIRSAYRKRLPNRDLTIHIDDKDGKVHGFVKKKVKEVVEDEDKEISLEEAKKLGFTGNVGDEFEVEILLEDVGRIAAAAAREVMRQKIRQAEKDTIYEEFKQKEGKLITGVVQRKERRLVFVDIGKIEGILPPREQVEEESYNYQERYKFYIVEVKRRKKDIQVVLSRTHPNLVRALLEFEVPEVADNLVKIKSIARDAGNRCKVAVVSEDPNIEPVGTCIGARGTRIQALMDELRGEKIEIIGYSDNKEEFIRNALAPAKIDKIILNEEENQATLIVDKEFLSLAIGKKGQNIKLASKLTNLKLDVFTEEEAKEKGVLKEMSEEIPEEGEEEEELRD